MTGMIASPVHGQASRWPEHSTGQLTFAANRYTLAKRLPSPSTGEG